MPQLKNNYQKNHCKLNKSNFDHQLNLHLKLTFSFPEENSSLFLASND